ncbi:MAG: DUF507 family protein [Myxococcota bacterium]
MKLYRAKVPVIAQEAIQRLILEGHIDVEEARVEEAEKDLMSIMENYLRQDQRIRERVKDTMSRGNIPYNEYGRTRSRISEQMNHPVGDDVERFLVRQFIEMLLNTPNVDEVYAEDKVIHRELTAVLLSHHVDEGAIRDAARERIKNVREGTVEYEDALNRAVFEEKKRRGLIGLRTAERQQRR